MKFKHIRVLELETFIKFIKMFMYVHHIIAHQNVPPEDFIFIILLQEKHL